MPIPDSALPAPHDRAQVATGEGLVTAWSDKEYGTYQLYRGKNGDGKVAGGFGEKGLGWIHGTQPRACV